MTNPVHFGMHATDARCIGLPALTLNNHASALSPILCCIRNIKPATKNQLLAASKVRSCRLASRNTFSRRRHARSPR